MTQTKRSALKAAGIGDMARWVAEIQVRAGRKVGELSAALEKSAGARTDQPIPANGKRSTKASALKAAKLSTSTANRCERIASIPEAEFEALIAEAKDSHQARRSTNRQARWRYTVTGTATTTRNGDPFETRTRIRNYGHHPRERLTAKLQILP